MSKKLVSKSIIANFGELSSSHSPVNQSVLSHTTVQPMARVGAGVIGATQRSLSDIREERDRLQAIVASGGSIELDPGLIDPSPIPDRLPDDSDLDFEALKKTIANEGQKIPIQVRKHPNLSGRYQIVYGHRRCRACRDLGIKVKAILVELTDVELVVAQGIENASRQDLSWIERALFAWRMDQAGIKARDIRAALSIDDSELARLRVVCRSLPAKLIEAIGRAPKVGRPRWVELATFVAGEPYAVERILKTLSADKVSALASDDRFRCALATVKLDSSIERDVIELRSSSGRLAGKASFLGGDIKLSVDKSRAEAFSSFLKSELTPLMDRFFAQEGNT